MKKHVQELLSSAVAWLLATAVRMRRAYLQGRRFRLLRLVTTLAVALGSAGPATVASSSDDSEALAERDANLRQFHILNDRLSDHMLAAVPGLAEDLLLQPDIALIRQELVTAVQEAEIEARRCYECRTSLEEGLVGQTLPAGGAGNHALDYCPSTCEGQFDNMMSNCRAIENRECRFPFKTICNKLKREAVRICQDTASCQYTCCQQGCLGTGCADYVIDGVGDPCNC